MLYTVVNNLYLKKREKKKVLRGKINEDAKEKGT